MPFSNPIIGGGGALIRDSIQSPNYIAGSAGWAIKRDGSAEFNNVTVRGKFATGAAGGPNAYLTIDDAVDRTTIAFWNAAGTNNAFINSPQSGGGVPQLGLNGGLANLPVAGVPGRSRIFMQEARTDISIVRASDQAAVGGNMTLTDSTGRLKYSAAGAPNTGGSLYVDSSQAIASRDVAGVATGGRMTVNATDGYLEYANAGAGQHGIRASSDGVHSFGSFPSDIAWSTVAGARATISEFRMDRWGPIVIVHVFFTVTTAIAAGDIADLTIATITSAGNVPLSQTSLACQWSAGVGAVSLDSAGVMLLRWTSTALAIGNTFRVDGAWFRSL